MYDGLLSGFTGITYSHVPLNKSLQERASNTYVSCYGYTSMLDAIKSIIQEKCSNSDM